MQWTDRVRHVKVILVIVAVLIAVISLIVSHRLIRDLEKEEQNKMEIWAEAMRTLNEADENTDLNLVLKVINENHTIPVIVMDSQGAIQSNRNIKLPNKSKVDSVAYVQQLGRKLKTSGKYIRIFFNESEEKEYIDVCYDDSFMLKRLSTYPYIQLGVVLIFVIVALFALLSSKKAEQNKVWVGLSKETAHQLGTPISSLMAWLAILKETYPDDTLIPEIDQDVKRLQLIADRFSKIGSAPELELYSLPKVLQNVVAYMNRRTSKKIAIESQISFEGNDQLVLMSPSLFEWVIENLCKNAVDAMGGVVGKIKISAFRESKKIVIEVSDTGKGIKKKDIKNVFRPGFTTKRRGWGLGLSLAKRIIEEYHNGKIFVKDSEKDKGTTFRIELKASNH
ncbi:HAMP domain-containing sensor histidine kinase [Hoylesella timonensis]|uniref:HAMP domain-containing sensor histidine kinase n=1 Tax=Hoylesella timonensis TaxID=386414 RepID=UPI00336AA1AF